MNSSRLHFFRNFKGTNLVDTCLEGAVDALDGTFIYTNIIFVTLPTHTRGFMAPYRNMRYWLGDFRRRRPFNGKEKFNHSHAKLKNVIERAYGVVKARFPILKRMTPFSLTTQRNITVACFALHNFIRTEGLDDELFSRATIDAKWLNGS
nr:putative harbinger transposase-derived nuclease domain-containing protein [Tanacetum cinerariifolium]